MNRRYVFTGIILVAVLVAGIVFLRRSQPIERVSQLPVSGAKAKGPANAPIQIHEYSDFECPACRSAVPVVAEMVAAFPNQIYFVFHHFPLDAHALSPLAHQAAECAAEVNQFWPYHDRLYADQAKWSKLADPTEEFLRYAKDLGISLDSFAACLVEDRIRRRILEEKAQGEKLRVTSTPTFFVNNERMVGAIELKVRGNAKIQEVLSNLWQSKEVQPKKKAPATSSF